ncbi:30265_t:CDS:2, partial [Gigaspora margarita]
DYDDEFNSSSGQDEESDVELASTSAFTLALSAPTLSTQNTNFFEKYTALELLDNRKVEVEKVSCKFEDCNTEYVWRGSTSNCITYLHNIYQITKKSLKDKLVKAKQQTIYQVISRPHSSHIQQKLTYQLVRYIVAYAQPISIVEDDDFRLWTKILISNLISRTSDKVSLTFNFWSSRAHDSYLEITCHWLTDSFDLYEIMLNIGELDKHHASDIIEAVFSITTDNSSNVKSAVQQIGIPNIKYAEHTLQLSVNLGLKEVDELILKYKALISILSKKKCRQLREAQLQVTPGLKKLLDIIKDVNTCWNFTLHAIERLIYLKPAIIQLYSTLNNYTIRDIKKGAETMHPYIPSLEEFELLEELIEILSLFDEAMQFLSGS